MTVREHRIRLAGVWEIAAESSAANPEPKWVRVRLDQLDRAGLPFVPARMRRFFGCPPGLEKRQAVRLEWDGRRCGGDIRFNGRRLAELFGPATEVRLRVDELLQPRNVIEEEFVTPPFDTRATPVWPWTACRLCIEER